MDVIRMARERFTRRFVVNEYIDVAWDEEEERVQVLVAGEPVLHCAFLVAAISPTDDEVSSIDDLAEREGARQLEGKDVRELLSIDEEVRAHASNIQAWAENGYNTRLLHSNISFTLLKALVKAGDVKAERVLDAELAERIRDGSRATRKAILESCGDMIYSPRSPFIDEFPVDERVDIWFNIGNTLYESSDMHGAVEAFRKVVAIKPDHAKAWNNLGVALKASGDVPGAVEAHRKAVAIKPDDADAWYNLGVVLKASGDVPGAVEAYRKAVAIKPDDADAWHNLGVALKASGDVPGAVEAHRKAVAIKPDHANAWNSLGVALKASGDVPGAVEALRKAVAIKPDNANAWNSLGIALGTSGDVRGAVEAHRKAIAIKPDHADAWDNLGVTLIDSGDVRGAVEAHRKATAIKPDHANAWHNLGVALKASGDVPGAVEAYRKAVTIRPDDANAWNGMSCVYTEGGKLVDGLDPGKKATILSDALAHARKAIELAPDVALYHTTLGEALEASGDVEGAVSAYKEALGLDPKEKYAIEYLERLGRLPR